VRILLRHPIPHPDIVVTTHGPTLLPASPRVWLGSLLAGAEIVGEPEPLETVDGWEGSAAWARTRAVARYRLFHLWAAVVVAAPDDELIREHREGIDRMLRGVGFDLEDETVVALSDLWEPR
jgi:hypothetical protein